MDADDSGKIYLTDAVGKNMNEVAVSSTGDVSEQHRDSDGGNSGSFAALRNYIRNISVEPTVVGTTFIITLYSILAKQYIRQRLSQDRNLDVNYSVSSCNVTSENMSDPNYVLQQQVSSETASWVLYLYISTFVPAFFSSILLGSWSDKVGRKIPLLLSLFGIAILGASYLTVILFSLPLSYLFVGHVLSGVLGDFGNILACSFSYVTDVSDTKTRTMRMAVLEVCIGIGGFVASITIGVWDLFKGFQGPFWCILSIAIFDILYIFFVLPLNGDGKAGNVFRHLFSKEPFQHMYQVIKPRQDHRHIVLILYAVCFCFLVMTTSGSNELLVIYEIGVPFCWNSLLVGIGSGLAQIGGFVSLILLKLIPGFSAEPKLLLLGVITNSISFVIFVFSQKTWTIFLGLVLQLFSKIPSPIIRSQSSRVVLLDEVGSVFAILSCAMITGNILSSLLFEGLFALTASSELPGAAFFVGTGFLLLLIPLYCVAYKKSAWNSSSAIQYSVLEVDP